MIANRQLTEEQTTLRRNFIDFFESDAFEDKYTRRLHNMMSEGKSRLIVDMNDLLDYTPAGSDVSLGRGILLQPGRYLPLCELAVHDAVIRRQPDYLKVDYRSKHIHVGLEGPVGRIYGPRELYAVHLNRLVALEGIVTKQSPLRPRILETVHYCPATNKYSRKEYRDQLTPMMDGQHLPTVNVTPKTDMQGNPLRTELGLCSFMDSQCVIMQEAPEASPTGQLPRNVELRLDDDLVDCVKPGDRVQVVGIFAPYTPQDNKGSFQSIVLVNNIIRYQANARIPKLLESHITEIKRFASELGSANNLVATLSNSIAPAVFGLKAEKRAVLMMLVGGVERKANNSHIRGDINVLFVGEPSTAKSQLLRYVLGLAPLALNTTGKGSSGVGLTAAVTVDSYTGERSLSAGAMVLADRGILCIDEFDKMSPQDRVAMHEAMEQQTVTIAKAGIQASLNARCSVLAAANPVYGFYSVKHKLSFNVGLPESLLSRFDLTFIILDQHSSEHNRRIGSHILKNHMTSKPVPFEIDMSKTVLDKEQDTREGAGRDRTGQSSGTDAGVGTLRNNSGERIVSVDFLRRYIEYAKTFTPMLTEASQQLISQHYVQLREEQNADNATKDGFFVTPRTLEALVRLATANAKVRLSNIVEEEDVSAAMALLRASVHAAGEAVEQRQRDNDAVQHDAADGGESPGSDGRPAAGGTSPGDDPDEPRRKSARLESGIAPTPATPAPTTLDVSAHGRVIIDTLSLFRREHRTEVHLHELRDRLSQSALARGVPIDLPALQSVMSQLESDAFSYSSTPTEDVIYFNE